MMTSILRGITGISFFTLFITKCLEPIAKIDTDINNSLKKYSEFLSLTVLVTFTFLYLQESGKFDRILKSKIRPKPFNVSIFLAVLPIILIVRSIEFSSLVDIVFLTMLATLSSSLLVLEGLEVEQSLLRILRNINVVVYFSSYCCLVCFQQWKLSFDVINLGIVFVTSWTILSKLQQNYNLLDVELELSEDLVHELHVINPENFNETSKTFELMVTDTSEVSLVENKLDEDCIKTFYGHLQQDEDAKEFHLMNEDPNEESLIQVRLDEDILRKFFKQELNQNLKDIDQKQSVNFPSIRENTSLKQSNEILSENTNSAEATITKSSMSSCGCRINVDTSTSGDGQLEHEETSPRSEQAFNQAQNIHSLSEENLERKKSKENTCVDKYLNCQQSSIFSEKIATKEIKHENVVSYNKEEERSVSIEASNSTELDINDSSCFAHKTVQNIKTKCTEKSNKTQISDQNDKICSKDELPGINIQRVISFDKHDQVNQSEVKESTDSNSQSLKRRNSSIGSVGELIQFFEIASKKPKVQCTSSRRNSDNEIEYQIESPRSRMAITRPVKNRKNISADEIFRDADKNCSNKKYENTNILLHRSKEQNSHSFNFDTRMEEFNEDSNKSPGFQFRSYEEISLRGIQFCPVENISKSKNSEGLFHDNADIQTYQNGNSSHRSDSKAQLEVIFTEKSTGTNSDCKLLDLETSNKITKTSNNCDVDYKQVSEDEYHKTSNACHKSIVSNDITPLKVELEESEEHKERTIQKEFEEKSEFNVENPGMNDFDVCDEIMINLIDMMEIELDQSTKANGINLNEIESNTDSNSRENVCLSNETESTAEIEQTSQQNQNIEEQTLEESMPCSGCSYSEFKLAELKMLQSDTENILHSSCTKFESSKHDVFYTEMDKMFQMKIQIENQQLLPERANGEEKFDGCEECNHNDHELIEDECREISIGKCEKYTAKGFVQKQHFCNEVKNLFPENEIERCSNIIVKFLNSHEDEISVKSNCHYSSNSNFGNSVNEIDLEFIYAVY